MIEDYFLIIKLKKGRSVRGWNPNIERGKSLKLIGRLGEAVSSSTVYKYLP